MDRKLNILYVEDNDADVDLMRELLAETPSYALAHVERLDQARQHLAKADTDLILLDLSLPDSQGIATFEKLYAEYNDIPIIILTGHDDEGQAIQEVGKGAQDYLVKGRFDDYALIRAIQYAVERHSLHRELERQMHRAQASEARLRHIIERSADGIVIVNRYGVARFVNPAAEHLFGYSSDDPLGDLFGFPTTPGERMVLDIERRDGCWATVEIYLVEIEWEGELAYLTSLRDITEHKEAEAQRAESAKRLQWVRDTEAAGQVAAQVGCNFSEILQEIAGQLTSIPTALSPEEKRPLLRSQDAARRGLDIAQTLMRFSPQTHSHPHAPVPIDELVRDVADFCSDHFGDTCRIETDIEGGPLGIEGDYADLKQALLNLCYNARDALSATDEQPKALIIAARNVPAGTPEGVCRRIDVTDNGIGMDPETQRRAFDPFFTTKPATQATGLGLTTAFAIARQHQGWIECESEEGLGTTFSLTLPVAPPRQGNGEAP